MTISQKDVDICVTCVTSKPPRLPLREELVSLGVEVILNARGTGAKAVDRQRKHALRKIRDQIKQLKKKRFKLFGRRREKKIKKEQQMQKIKRELRKVRQGISYRTYTMKMTEEESSDSSSASSASNFSFGHHPMQRFEIVGYQPPSFASDFPSQPPNVEIISEPSLSSSDNEPQSWPDYSLPMLENSPISPFAKQKRDKKNADTVNAISPFSQKTSPTKSSITSGSERNDQEEERDTATLNESTTAYAGSTLSSMYMTEDNTDNNSLESSIVAIAPKHELVSASGDRWWYDVDGKAMQGPNIDGFINHPPHPSIPVLRMGQELQDLSTNGEDTSTSTAWKTMTVNFTEAVRRPVGPGQTELFELQPSEINAIRLLTNRPNGGEGSTSGSDVLSEIKADLIGAGALYRKVSKTELLEKLNDSSVSLASMKWLLEANRSLLKSKELSTGKLPLHEICERELPDRFRDEAELDDLIGLLQNDISSYRDLVELVASMNVDACITADKNGDLPLHLTVRRLLEWEQDWESKIEDSNETSKFESLYTTARECVEILLRPVVPSRAHCRKRGSKGRILPLHAAAMFRVSYETVREALVTYPDAASSICNLPDLRTRFWAESLPLELIETKRKFETGGEKGDWIGASDLIFSFHPRILPYRKEEDRLRRIEAMVVEEANRVVSENSKQIDPAVQSVWVWMCTFDGQLDDVKDCYSGSVENIVYSVDVEVVKRLISLRTYGGSIMSISSPDCTEVIQARLQGKPRTHPVKIQHNVAPESPQVETVEPLSMGYLLKLVFNVKEDDHPTAFVVLPYKLKRDSDGGLTLANAKMASVAFKFAQLLITFTSPLCIKYYLEKKSVQHAGHRLSPTQKSGWNAIEARNKSIQDEFLDMYKSSEAFLYLVDERTGVPVVRNNSCYPLEVSEARRTVEQLLPLMVMGMVLMRGDRSLAVILTTILQSGNESPSEWIEACQQILDYMKTAPGLRSPGLWLGNAVELKNEIAELVSNWYEREDNSSRVTDDGEEWAVEINLLQALLAQFDPSKEYAGLKRRKTVNDSFIWTQTQMGVLKTKGTDAGKGAAASRPSARHGSPSEAIAKGKPPKKTRPMEIEGGVDILLETSLVGSELTGEWDSTLDGGEQSSFSESTISSHNEPEKEHIFTSESDQGVPSLDDDSDVFDDASSLSEETSELLEEQSSSEEESELSEEKNSPSDEDSFLDEPSLSEELASIIEAENSTSAMYTEASDDVQPTAKDSAQPLAEITKGEDQGLESSHSADADNSSLEGPQFLPSAVLETGDESSDTSDKDESLKMVISQSCEASIADKSASVNTFATNQSESRRTSTVRHPPSPERPQATMNEQAQIQAVGNPTSEVTTSSTPLQVTDMQPPLQLELSPPATPQPNDNQASSPTGEEDSAIASMAPTLSTDKALKHPPSPERPVVNDLGRHNDDNDAAGSPTEKQKADEGGNENSGDDTERALEHSGHEDSTIATMPSNHALVEEAETKGGAKQKEPSGNDTEKALEHSAHEDSTIATMPSNHALEEATETKGDVAKKEPSGNDTEKALEHSAHEDSTIATMPSNHALEEAIETKGEVAKKEPSGNDTEKSLEHSGHEDSTIATMPSNRPLEEPVETRGEAEKNEPSGHDTEKALEPSGHKDSTVPSIGGNDMGLVAEEVASPASSVAADRSELSTVDTNKATHHIGGEDSTIATHRSKPSPETMSQRNESSGASTDKAVQQQQQRQDSSSTIATVPPPKPEESRDGSSDQSHGKSSGAATDKALRRSREEDSTIATVPSQQAAETGLGSPDQSISSELWKMADLEDSRHQSSFPTDKALDASDHDNTTISTAPSRRMNDLFSLGSNMDSLQSPTHSVVERTTTLLAKRLDEQEAQLDKIRSKLSTVDLGQASVVQNGQMILEDLRDELEEYDAKSSRPDHALAAAAVVEGRDDEAGPGPFNKGALRTRRLLLRLCHLEDRLLSREIELQQLKLDLHSFELHSVVQGEDLPVRQSE